MASFTISLLQRSLAKSENGNERSALANLPLAALGFRGLRSGHPSSKKSLLKFASFFNLFRGSKEIILANVAEVWVELQPCPPEGIKIKKRWLLAIFCG
jgi:hypothetical protein